MLATTLWDALTAAGGSFALTFIVAIALAILANVVVFLGSAVVVLERFSRAARSPGWILLVSLVWSLALGFLGTGVEGAEQVGSVAARMGFDWTPGPVGAWLATSAALFAWLVAAQLLVALLLRFVPPFGLAVGAVVLLGGGAALAVGSLDRPGYAVAPAALAGLVCLVLGLRRRRHGGGPVGPDERLARWLLLVLAAGAWVPFAIESPSRDLAALGLAAMGVFAALVMLGLLPLAAAGLLDTRGSAEWFVATRYLFAKRRQTFVSFITLICVAGVAVGVWLIITVLSVMNGFERTWRDEIIGNRAHFTIHNPLGPMEGYEDLMAKIVDVPEVLGASPYVDGEGMVRGPRGEIVGVRVRGIDPERVVSVTDLEDDLMPGSEEALERLARLGNGNAEGGDPGLVIGSQLAAMLGARVGDEIVLISPFGGPPTPLGPGPRLKRFQVTGIFQSSFFQYDEVFTYTSLPAAQDFRRTGDVVHGIEVRTTDYYRSRAVARDVEGRLGFPYFTRDWKEFFPAFFQALKTERMLMSVLLAMIMVVASFAIVVTLIMMIMEKSGDIAILKTMGATEESVERIFAIEGTLIGLVGTALGVVAGIAVTTQLDWVQGQIEALTGVDTLPATIYQFSTLPYELNPGQIAVVVGVSMVLSLGATLLPSRHGAQLDPAEALRYE